MAPWSSARTENQCCELYDNTYFGYCALGGALACGLSHFALTPIDMIKCRIQLNPCGYRSLIYGLRAHYQAGPRCLLKGWLPTLLGYSLHGAVKFSSYEFFKYQFAELAGDERTYLYRAIIFLTAAASAEILATTFLSPFEVMKIRLQTYPNYTNSMLTSFRQILCSEGYRGFYRGIKPLWARQVPYTMMKFVTFENAIDLLYAKVIPKPREQCSKGEQNIVTFVAGFISGALSAAVSQPADYIVTRMYHDPSARADCIARNYSHCFSLGLQPRMIMAGTITGLQWFIYEWFQDSYGMPRPPPPELPSSLRKKGYA